VLSTKGSAPLNPGPPIEGRRKMMNSIIAAAGFRIIGTPTNRWNYGTKRNGQTNKNKPFLYIHLSYYSLLSSDKSKGMGLFRKVLQKLYSSFLGQSIQCWMIEDLNVWWFPRH
jgi:hypothetical protein